VGLGLAAGLLSGSRTPPKITVEQKSEIAPVTDSMGRPADDAPEVEWTRYLETQAVRL
jgi:hypothetical protein